MGVPTFKEEVINSIKFKALRESLGLSTKDVANLLKIKSDRTVRYWESGAWDIPEYGSELLNNFFNKFVDMSINALELAAEQDVPNISILMYQNQGDYEEFAPDIAIDIPLAKMHRIFTYWISVDLEMDGHNISLVEFKRDEYLSWLAENSKMNNTVTRAEWAAKQC